MTPELTILPPLPDRVVCTNGHVTNPWIDINTRDGTLAEFGDPRGEIEKGSAAWTTICRRVVNMSAQRSGHQCRAVCVPLGDDDALAAAYSLGGEEAVRAIFHERNTSARL